MLGNSPYNFKTIEKITAAFGWIFSDISMERVNPNDNSIKTIKVPIELSTKEKWDRRLRNDPNAGDEEKQRPISMILPRMGYQLTGHRYDARRKLSSINFRVNATGNGPTAFKQLNPVPMLFYFSLYLNTRNLEDGYNIISQFLPFFQPDYTVPILDIPEMNLKRDIIVLLLDSKMSDTYEGNYLDRRVLEWEFNFEVRGHLYPPIREKKVITEVDININPNEDGISFYSRVEPESANIDEPVTVYEEVQPSTGDNAI